MLESYQQKHCLSHAVAMPTQPCCCTSCRERCKQRIGSPAYASLHLVTNALGKLQVLELLIDRQDLTEKQAEDTLMVSNSVYICVTSNLV